MLYLDDDLFFFKYRADIERGITLLSNHFAQFGIEIHIGTINNTSKAECIFFPPPFSSIPALHYPLASLNPPCHSR